MKTSCNSFLTPKGTGFFRCTFRSKSKIIEHNDVAISQKVGLSGLGYGRGVRVRSSRYLLLQSLNWHSVSSTVALAGDSCPVYLASHNICCIHIMPFRRPSTILRLLSDTVGPKSTVFTAPQLYLALYSYRLNVHLYFRICLSHSGITVTSLKDEYRYYSCMVFARSSLLRNSKGERGR